MPPLRGRPSHQTTSSSFANEDDVLDYMSDTEDTTPAADNQPSRADEVRKAICITNLPITTPDKTEKLKSRVLDMLEAVDKDQKGDKIILHMPLDDQKSTLGFAFAAYSTEDLAKSAVELLNKYMFGKQELSVFPYSDLERLSALSDTYVPPEPKKYTPGVDLSWLEDGRDQFVMRYGAETVVSWVDSVSMSAETQVAYDGAREKKEKGQWCKMHVQWSPLGTYLATFHAQGLAIWGGEQFIRPTNGRFSHPGVSHALFSPCERYLISWDGQDNGTDRESMIAWNLGTSEKARIFAVPAGSEWPLAKWSCDGSFFARRIENGISLFETPSMKLAGKPIPAKGIVAFEFSPSDHLLAYWAPEEDNAPARVVILDVKTRREVRSANLFQVTSCKLVWQSAGDFLCAQVLRHTKTKKSTFTNFEIFRVRDEGVPNETLSVQHAIEYFAFEPAGTRFGIIASNEGRNEVSFYSLGNTRSGSKLVALVSLENKPCSQLHWAPVGGMCLLAGMESSMNGTFEFYDVDAKQSLGQVEHYSVTDVQWDPSGRMVATIVAQRMFGTVSVREALENGFRLWSFQGQRLQDKAINEFYQFLWRPRPKSLLSEDDLDKLKQKLPQYARKYEREDELVKKRRQAAENAERIKQLIEFRELMAEAHRVYLAQLAERRRLGWWKDDKNDLLEITELTEELVSEKAEVVSGGSA